MQVAADGALEAREEAERVNRDKTQELSEFEAALKQLEATHAEELALARATIQEKDDELAKSLEANHLTTSERNALRTSYDQKDADNGEPNQQHC